MRKNWYEIEGRRWISISKAAELLGTNAQGVRKMMAEGALDWRQTRANSRTFVVDEQAVMALRQQRPTTKLKRSPDPLAPRPEWEPNRRQRGGLGQAHHLRLTLPAREEDEPK